VKGECAGVKTFEEPTSEAPARLFSSFMLFPASKGRDLNQLLCRAASISPLKANIYFLVFSSGELKNVFTPAHSPFTGHYRGIVLLT